MDIKQTVQAILLAAKQNLITRLGRTGVGVQERAHWKPKWKIEKYHGDAKPENLYAVEEFAGNLLLNEGIAELEDLLIGEAATAYDNANTYIGVGDSNTAAAATQTGLQAATNKLWKGMDLTYPQRTDQTITFRATFEAAEANYDWKEFTVVNAADDTGDNLCRKVEDHGTKANGDTWVITVTVTIS